MDYFKLCQEALDLISSDDSNSDVSEEYKQSFTADNSGISLEKAASWIATILSVTRESASTIGTSLKSIIFHRG